MGVRVGVDLVSVETVRESVLRHGARYLERVYTTCELEACTTEAGVDPERLAARFAAKEATIKVLRPAEQAVPWQTIEVRSDPNGWVDLELSGEAAALAQNAGVRALAVSLTHEGDLASAVVIAELDPGCR